VERVPEPELMTEPSQAEAYARADFEDAHSGMMQLLRDRVPASALKGWALDLGCGPGDIAYRLARIAPDLHVHGVDGSRAMLEAGAILRNKYRDVADRVTLLHGLLPECTVPRERYDLVVSNSLLHHLGDPGVLWWAIRRWAGPGAWVFVMDLHRPADRSALADLVDRHARDEPEVLRRDFANSLAAAYRVEEVQAQMADAGLAGLTAERTGDRHLIVHGRMPTSDRGA